MLDRWTNRLTQSIHYLSSPSPPSSYSKHTDTHIPSPFGPGCSYAGTYLVFLPSCNNLQSWILRLSLLPRTHPGLGFDSAGKYQAFSAMVSWVRPALPSDWDGARCPVSWFQTLVPRLRMRLTAAWLHHHLPPPNPDHAGPS